METKEFLDKLQEVKDFVEQVYKDVQTLKGIHHKGETRLIFNPIFALKGAVTHDRWTCSLYRDEILFSISLLIGRLEFKGWRRSGGEIYFYSDNLENFLQNEQEYREIWDYAKTIPHMSIVELEIKELEGSILYRQNQNRVDREKIKRIKEEYGITGKAK